MCEITTCKCKCLACVTGNCHKTQPEPQPKDDDVGKLLEQKLRGHDARPERDTRPPPMCCERIGSGSWCWLVAGHPATTPHEGAAPRVGPAPEAKFATGKQKVGSGG
jgi:hypothetical protein